ncbi:ABC transporter ATP-binding protein [Jiangella aurantiaca]|uniref:ABC transporter ATP-binding protein n=1 Tax=Jiangella aurantiaca TaxID=2530373 RepID=A0A4R5A7A0_9ACTN|nr:ABC transporter ATP-binding protein [Jiangella aurantiaca]TDD66504.1 ABC transporter ATP-binding protein [Jiangella aurantiaca]
MTPHSDDSNRRAAAVAEKDVAAPADPTAVGRELAATGTILRIDGLRTYFHGDESVVKAVDGVSLDVPRGRTMCVVGESGCGKSITARSVLGLIDPPGRIEGGHLWWHPDPEAPAVDLAGLDPRGDAIRQVRGGQIGMVFQEPMASLSPMYTIGDQLVQAIRLHRAVTPAEARELAIAQLRRVGIPQPERRFDAYSFQLSGGMCQRVMIAIALSCDPALLIADEPTTALDVTTQARILDLIAQLQEETGMSVMFITHDLGVVAEIADDVTVMYLGTAAEQGSVTDIFDRPRHPYTQALLASVPTLGQARKERLAAIAGMVPSPENRPVGCPFHTRCPSVMPGLCDVTAPAVRPLGDRHAAACHLLDPGLQRPPVTAPPAAPATAPVAAAPPAAAGAVPPATEPLLSVRGLRMTFPVKKGFFGRTVGHVQAVDDVDLDVFPGETLGLVGESGCGKTTLGRCIVRALDPTAGTVLYRDPDTGAAVDLARLGPKELRPYREQVRVIFQDPFGSLNPRKTLLQLISEPLRRIHSAKLDSTVEDQVAAMLRRVGLRPEYLRRYPHAFSGGQRQRINIARALITRPRLVIADEAVSALDVSIRAQILNLLRDLQDEYRLTYLFISHDLSVVEHACDRVAVMYLGRIVEQARTVDLFRGPRHPYTEALLSAVPVPDPHLRGAGRRIRLADELPDPSAPPPGCRFHTRCPHRQETRCDTESPALARAGAGDGPAHLAACHFSTTLALRGVAGPTGDEEGTRP